MNPLELLAEIQKEEEIKRNESVVYRVLNDLIKIEKEALYGVRVANKNARIDKIFDDGFARYKEEVSDAAKTD